MDRVAGNSSAVSAVSAISRGISAASAPGAWRRGYVRRRSTVRFRNGAPGHGQFSNDSNERRGTSPGDARQLPSHRKLRLHSQGSAAVTEGSRRRAVPGPPGHCPGEVKLGRSCSGRAVSGPGEPHQDPGSAWRLPVSSGSAVRGKRVPGSRLRAWDGRVTSEARMPTHRFTPSGPGTSSRLDGAEGTARGLRTCRCEYVQRVVGASPACLPVSVRRRGTPVYLSASRRL